MLFYGHYVVRSKTFHHELNINAHITNRTWWWLMETAERECCLLLELLVMIVGNGFFKAKEFVGDETGWKRQVWRVGAKRRGCTCLFPAERFPRWCWPALRGNSRCLIQARLHFVDRLATLIRFYDVLSIKEERSIYMDDMYRRMKKEEWISISLKVRDIVYSSICRPNGNAVCSVNARWRTNMMSFWRIWLL